MMKRKKFVILLMSLLLCSHTAYAVFDIFACIESLLELKTEIEHKVEEIQKKIKDEITRARQGFDLASNCFTNPLQCNPDDLTTFLNYINEDRRLVKGAQRVHSAWGFTLGKQSSPLHVPHEELLDDIQVKYTYNRGQGKDIEKLSENREEINNIVGKELALMFAKGATTHNDIQNEDDSKLYTFDLNNDNMDEILNAQNRVVLMTAVRLARILEFRSNIISSAATSEMTLQNQENIGE